MDLKSVNNLLDFLEKTFNGGSDFNAPVQRCLDRLTDSKWANSDILLVSDGELRQPGPDIMRKLSGAKDKLSLRVHGLIVGSPDKKRADPAVLRGLCSQTLPNGKNEVRQAPRAGPRLCCWGVQWLVGGGGAEGRGQLRPACGSCDGRA